MLIVGIDPGSMFTGFAQIREVNGQVTRFITCFKASVHFPHRYMVMRERLEYFLLRLPAHPNLIVIERPLDILPTTGSLKSIFHLQGGYAVVAAEVGRLFGTGVPLITPNCREWMEGRERDAKAVYEQLGKKYNYTSFTTDDEADALGLADYGYRLRRSDHDRNAVGKGPASNLPVVAQEGASGSPGGEHRDPRVAS